MKILCISAWFPAGPIRFLSEAFEYLGHEVRRVGPCRNDHGSISWGKDEIHADIILPNELRQWNLPEYLDRATEKFGKFDCVFLSEENYQTDIVPLPKSIPSFLWVLDGHPENYQRHEVWQASINYSANCLGTQTHPRESIHPAWRWLPTAWAPWAHPRINFDQSLRTWDFCLHASQYGKRPRMCEDLRQRGLKVRSGFVATPEYVYGNNFSLFTYHNCQRNGGECKYRFYEATGMGCVVISDKSELMEDAGYLPWVHFIPFPDNYLDDELWPRSDKLAECMEFMEKPYAQVRLREISNTAFKFTSETHTYLQRAQRIIGDLRAL